MADSSSTAEDSTPQVAAPSARALFRQAAIDYASGSPMGEPLTLYWRGMRLFTVTAVALMLALIAFTALVDYAPIHRVPAFADVSGGLIRLSAIADARVARIVAAEGERVQRGTLLVVLDTDRQSAAGPTRREQLTSKIEGEKATLTREIAAAREEAQAQRDAAERRIEGLRVERVSLQAEITAVESLLTSLRRQSERIATLAASGHATAMHADQKRDEVTLQESRLAAARAALARADRDIDGAASERRLIDSRLAGVVESRERTRGELDRQATQAEAEAEQAIVAPEAGVVSASLVTRGQSVVAGQTLLTLAPDGEALVLRLVVPPRAVASVVPGADIKIVFDAYPQEKFGEFNARIDKVSDAPLSPVDLPQIYASGGPAFIAVASLGASPTGPHGPLVVKPGMLATALVPMERRSALEWLLEPLLRGFNASAGRAHEVTSR